MKVLFLYENMNVLAGAVRAMLGIADYTKHLGHQVTILAEKPTAASLTHYNIRQTRKYYPLPNLRNRDIKLMRIFDNKEAIRIIEDADLTWAFSQFLCRIDEHARCKPKRLWGYIHYPNLRSGVSINLEKLWCIPYGSLVETPLGAIPIQNCFVGMPICGERNDKICITQVMGIRETVATDNLWELKSESESILEATTGHRIFVNGRYVPIERLKIGDELTMFGVTSNEKGGTKIQKTSRIRREMEFPRNYMGISGWIDRWRRNNLNLWIKSKKLETSHSYFKHRYLCNGVVEENIRHKLLQIASWSDRSGDSIYQGMLSTNLRLPKSLLCSKTDSSLFDNQEKASGNDVEIYRGQMERKTLPWLLRNRSKPNSADKAVEQTRKSWVASIEKKDRSNCIVYDLATGTQNFFVNGILVHNCNSTYTLNAVKARMWPQSANAEVLYPHVPVRHYKNLDYSKRDIDVIVYSRVSPDKGFNLLGKLKESLPQANIEAAGADLPSKPWALGSKPKEAHYNLLFSEVRDMLARSKIYIHFRGFIMDPEHYGISCAEAQSSGCVIVVHKSGGPYLDLLCGEQGKYGFYYETWDELVEKVKMVLGDEALWRKVSHDARGRVAEMMKQTESKLEKALGEKKL